MDKQVTKSYLYMFITTNLIVVMQMIAGALIGQFNGSDGVAAYSLAVVIPEILLGLIMAINYGMQAVCSKQYGEGNMESASKTFSLAFNWTIIINIVIGIILIVFGKEIAELLGASGENEFLLKNTMNLIYTVPFISLTSGLFSILASVLYLKKEYKIAYIAIAIFFLLECVTTAIMVHITNSIAIFNYCLAFSTLVADLFMFHQLNKDKENIHFTRITLKLKEFAKIFSIGAPELMTYFYYGIYNLFFNLYVLNKYNANIVSANAVGDNITNIAEIFMLGACLLTITLVGIEIGKNDKDGQEKVKKRMYKLFVISSIVFAVLFLASTNIIISLFIDEPNATVQENIWIYMIFYCAGLPFYIFNCIAVSIYEVEGRIKESHLVYILQDLILMIIFTILLDKLFGINGIWAANLATQVLITTIILINNKKNLTKKI